MIPRPAQVLGSGSSVTRSGDAFEARKHPHLTPDGTRPMGKRGYSAAALPNMCSPRIVCHRSSRSRCRRHVPPRIRPARDGRARCRKLHMTPCWRRTSYREGSLRACPHSLLRRRQKISLPCLPDEPQQHPQPACTALVVIFHDRYGDVADQGSEGFRSSSSLSVELAVLMTHQVGEGRIHTHGTLLQPCRYGTSDDPASYQRVR